MTDTFRDYYDSSVPPSLYAEPAPHVEVMAAKSAKKAKASTPPEPPAEGRPETTSDEPPAEG